MACRRKIKDSQPAVREGDSQSVSFVADEFDAFIVGAAMMKDADRRVDWPDQFRSWPGCDDAENAAHREISGLKSEI